MEIQKLNANIKWQQLTAQEILKYQKEGEEVPNEYQKWAAAISSVLDVSDEVTYEMTNGETDIAALEETLGRDILKTDIQPADETENNIGKENEDTEDEATPVIAQEEASTPEKTQAGQQEITLADEAITTDPNEILKRKQRRGAPPLS